MLFVKLELTVREETLLDVKLVLQERLRLTKLLTSESASVSFYFSY